MCQEYFYLFSYHILLLDDIKSPYLLYVFLFSQYKEGTHAISKTQTLPAQCFCLP